ncbi:MAG: chemotaxis protein CheW [Tissierellales bacterium]|jgi:purine-binding chemotaxis protein CheW|nr:chemotaxis protein CheW [Tissierellales bacterium]
MSERQFVVFRLESEEYAIDIMNVKEIGPYELTTKVPNSPDFITGVVNYRGEVIPIIDLKKKFMLEESHQEDEKRVIVIGLDGKQIGFVVDEASETIIFEESEVDPPPEIIIDKTRKYITGVGKKENRLIIIIDLSKVLSKEEQNKVKNLKVD